MPTRLSRISRFLRLAALLLIAVSALTPATASGRTTEIYNTAFLTDQQLEDSGAMGVDAVRGFLNQKGSYFSRIVTDVDGEAFDASEVIVAAAQKYTINPRVLLVTLQKESSAVTNGSRPSDTKMKSLMGCGAASTARDQLGCAAERFRAYQDRLTTRGATPSGWQVGVPKATQDGVTVTPATKAVAGQFTYTPYAGAEWGGNQPRVHGVYLFYKVWQDFGFGGAREPGQDQAQGSASPAIRLALPGEVAQFTVTATNAGTTTWQTATYGLAGDSNNPEGLRASWPLANEVRPGGSASWPMEWQAPEAPGAKRIIYRMTHNGEGFGAEIQVYVVVLPPQLKNMKADLEAQLEQWRREGEQSAEQLIDRLWAEIQQELEAQAQNALDKLLQSLSNAISCNGAAGLIVLALGSVVAVRRRR